VEKIERRKENEKKKFVPSFSFDIEKEKACPFSQFEIYLNQAAHGIAKLKARS